MDIDRALPEVQRILRSMVIVIKAFLMISFAWIVASVVRTALGISQGLSPLFLPVVVAMLVGPVIWYSLKLRPYRRR
jgi:hypothetical protein